jgi:hypothetical protein
MAYSTRFTYFGCSPHWANLSDFAICALKLWKTPGRVRYPPALLPLVFLIGFEKKILIEQARLLLSLRGFERQ